MYVIRDNELLSSQLAQYLNRDLMGEDHIILNVSKEQNLKEWTVFFLEDIRKKTESSGTRSLLITTEEIFNKIKSNDETSYIISPNPRLDFYKIVNEFFLTKKTNTISSKAHISVTAKIGYNVHIGNNTYIGNNVKIGNNTCILDNAIIEDECIIGSNCIIKQGAIIGSDGFEFLEDDGVILDVPQFGVVLIGNNVLIGANTSIERPNFDKTIICDGVKIDDGVNIGQGTVIGENTRISAGVVIAINVIIGEDCAIGINASIKEGVEIHRDVVIGMGSNVIKFINEPGVYFGNPALKH